MKVLKTVKKGYETKEVYSCNDLNDIQTMIEFNIMRTQLNSGRSEEITVKGNKTIFEYKYLGDLFQFTYEGLTLTNVTIYRHHKVF